ncbi:DUF6053 domain-containing protein [Lysobacter enzymogenes]|uniref:DUF6053 domain-containing protein n=1 Tax=Lysobacter enzymogenes TaxID=69 RepID=UPI003D18D518
MGRFFFVGGPSGPMLFSQIAAICNKSIGPEGPPTRALAFKPRAAPPAYSGLRHRCRISGQRSSRSLSAGPQARVSAARWA